jgi:hypothetical protein
MAFVRNPPQATSTCSANNAITTPIR